MQVGLMTIQGTQVGSEIKRKELIEVGRDRTQLGSGQAKESHTQKILCEHVTEKNLKIRKREKNAKKKCAAL